MFAKPPCFVRIEGERGTGKNLAAESLHHASGCSGRFVRCSLAAVSAQEGREVGELFGWTRGAFTGALQDRPGVFEQAHGGTLFLNELGLASPRVQEVLLHALEEQAVQRIGEAIDRPIDARIVFGTNINLEAAVEAGRFRADLYDRLELNVVTIPPLRLHLEDIPEMTATLMVRIAARFGLTPPELRPGDLDRLMSHQWPGNVRELGNHLGRFILTGEFPSTLPRARRPVWAWRATLLASIAGSGGNKSAAARKLGISRKTLYKRLRATSETNQL